MSIDVRIENVSLTLSRSKILDDVSIDVPSGSFVTLLGPSGSGKSTTLNVLAGFLKPDEGSILFAGEDVSALPPGARQMGIVFQNYAIFPHMTVGENIEFPLTARRWKGDRKKRVTEMLELVKLGGFENRRAATLSGGQLQRVALARALVSNPNVLLLDEPLSALDKQLRESMQSELKGIQREVGVTTISVTHDQSEALSMSDHVVVMNQGRIEQQGNPEQLYSEPRTEFLARFLGEVNLFPIDPFGVAAPLSERLPDKAGELVVVRPEDFSIVELGASGDHTFPARISQVQFQGGTCRVEVQIENRKEPVTIRTTYGGMGTLLEPGREITVAYSFSYFHTVPKERTT